MRYKVCLECSKPMIGRRDKKFCDDGCRNAYHNRLNSERPYSVRSVNSILSKNRRIISQILLKESNQLIPENKLIKMGFNFDYFTSQTTKNNKVYKYCYEYAYVNEDKDQYFLFPAPTKQ
ncbi:MAG: hypothetical protein IT245_03880 [Bacteroidia bacterium]|nr:hypothetical protein [Bacteroidia bacterium]